MEAISYLLISEDLLINEKPMKPIHLQKISFDPNDKVKMTVKDKISINFFKKEVSVLSKR